MKKTNIIILTGTFLFSYLFFEQLPGVNFTLFTLLFTGALLYLNPHKIKDRSWWVYALLANVCGVAVFFVTSGLSAFATIASLVVLAGRTAAPLRSFPVSGLITGLSIATSPYFILREGVGYLNSGNGKRNKRKTLIAVVIALVASIPFLLLYRSSNPLFAQFVDNIDMSRFDAEQLVFTIFCLFSMYGLFKVRGYQWIEKLEDTISRDITRVDENEHGVDNVSTVGLVLFILLNLMLLFMNVLDINQLYISKTLPDGITLSEFVHEAVTATIVSIIIAVSFIAFLFRGGLNFSPAGRTIKALVYAWILQTGMVITSTIVRNAWYISEYQLTGLRVGVFIFLLLAIIGLTFTWGKVSAGKSAWWMIAVNTKVWYVVLVLAATVNWARVITAYNINHLPDGKKLDVGYLIDIGGNLSQMVELSKTHPFTPEEEKILRKRVSENDRRWNELQWQGYSMRMVRNKEAVEELNRQMKPMSR